jgi:glutathione synthase/RimK-type ligase-like ATP-grasp enzyme
MLKTKKTLLFRPRIRSRHPSHDPIRKSLPKFTFRSVVRFGSTTEVNDVRVEINTVEAITNSSNKLFMKTCFSEAEVKTSDWWTSITGGNHFNSFNYQGENSLEEIIHIENLPYPIVAKQIFGSRGRGNTLIRSHEQLESFINGKNLSNYIFEKFYNYNREYRLHITEEGCFYACRKMLKSDTPESNRWYRNDSNSVWILESNEDFNKPSSWDSIVEHCVKALKSCKLDVGACDVKVSSKDDNKFIVIEINSAPSFGDLTLEKYKEIIPRIIQKKYERTRNTGI